MASFGIAKHAHIDAGFLSLLFTILVYGIKWVFGLRFPDFIFGLPAFLVLFLGIYVIFYIAFLIVWSRK